MLPKIKSILRQKGFEVYDRPFELNIVGLRSKATRANRFDDEIHVFCNTPSGWLHQVYKATTDPGTFWLKNPMAAQGTAILAEGQYRGAYVIGLHKGQYKALVQQKGPVKVIRDYNRNSSLDFFSGKASKGYFGINIHRAKAVGTTLSIDKYSAGCQVFQNAGDFQQFLTLCEKHRSLYGNSFTYTLIDFRAVQRETIRRIFLTLTGAVLAITGAIFFGYELSSAKPASKAEGRHRKAA